MISTVDLVLTGARAGQTVVLNGKQFQNGVLRLRGSHEQLEPVLSYYGRTYHAFPYASAELKAAQDRDAAELEKKRGHHQTNSVAEQRATDGVERAGADDNAGGDQAAHGSAALGSGDHGAEGRSSRVLPSGDGHADAGLRSGQEPQQQQSHAAGDLTKIREAVHSLDPNVDEFWTEAGLPAVAAVAVAMGDATVSRKQIEAAAPDWNRDQARAR